MATEPLMFVTGTHTFTITDYSIIKDISNKSGIQSESFEVGGYQWMIEFYPTGSNINVCKCISVHVRVLDNSQPVKAMYSLRMKDWITGKWSTKTPSCTSLITFGSLDTEDSRKGHPDYHQKSAFNKSPYLKEDGTIEIRCTLWVPPRPPNDTISGLIRRS